MSQEEMYRRRNAEVEVYQLLSVLPPDIPRFRAASYRLNNARYRISHNFSSSNTSGFADDLSLEVKILKRKRMKRKRSEMTKKKQDSKKGRSWGTASSIDQPRNNLEKIPAKSAPLELQPMSIVSLAYRGQIGE